MNEEICTCPCHQVGRMIMHCMPCCDRCDIKYLDEDGKLIPEKLYTKEQLDESR